MKDQEIEVKFYVSDLAPIVARLSALGAKLLQERIHEINLRFDTPEGSFTRAEQVIRLRKDVEARLTYKGPSLTLDGARLRREIEFSVSDFDAAREFLLALGLQISLIYEKYRTTYELDDAMITLDEMPYGNFVEIEAADPAIIRAVNLKLGLDWDARILDSYAALFARLQVVKGLAFRDLTFANFENIPVTPSDLGVQAAG